MFNYYMLLGGTLAKSYMCVCVCVCIDTYEHIYIYIYKQMYIPIPMMMIYAFIHNLITNSFIKAIMGFNCLAFSILNNFSVWVLKMKA